MYYVADQLRITGDYERAVEYGDQAREVLPFVKTARDRK
jgi:hypothetical protein